VGTHSRWPSFRRQPCQTHFCGRVVVRKCFRMRTKIAVWEISLSTQHFYSSELLGVRTLSRILNTRKHNVSENGSVSVPRWEGGDTYSVGSLRKS
jgi:hypothetical protein